VHTKSASDDHEILPEVSAVSTTNTFICDELVNGDPCGMDFLTEEALISHKPTHRKLSQTISDEPGTSADNEPSVVNGTLTCDVIVNGETCGRSFSTEQGLFTHKNRAPGHKLYVPKSKRHLLLKHEDGTFKCDEIVDGEVCGKSFLTMQAQS